MLIRNYVVSESLLQIQILPFRSYHTWSWIRIRNVVDPESLLQIRILPFRSFKTWSWIRIRNVVDPESLLQIRILPFRSFQTWSRIRIRNVVDPESLLQIRILPFPVISNLELDPDITLQPRQEKRQISGVHICTAARLLKVHTYIYQEKVSN